MARARDARFGRPPSRGGCHLLDTSAEARRNARSFHPAPTSPPRGGRQCCFDLSPPPRPPPPPRAPASLASPPAFATDIDTPLATDYVTSGGHGTLNVRRKPRLTATGSPTRTWDPGVHYVAAIRGGLNGVTVDSGQQIFPQPAMYIIEQGKDLTKPENQGLIPGNSAAEKAAAAAQLDALRRNYEAGPFPVISAAFPKAEIATLTTFQIAPVGTGAPAAHVVIDSGSGVVPLPFNALLDGSTLPDDPLAP